jgi:signal transduction histidine kinase
MPEIIDVRDIIFDTVKYNQVHASSLKKQKLVAKFDDNLPHFLEVDPVRLQTTINNLLRNAINVLDFKAYVTVVCTFLSEIEELHI